MIHNSTELFFVLFRSLSVAVVLMFGFMLGSSLLQQMCNNRI